MTIYQYLRAKAGDRVRTSQGLGEVAGRRVLQDGVLRLLVDYRETVLAGGREIPIVQEHMLTDVELVDEP
jgi:hypothetical protein